MSEKNILKYTSLDTSEIKSDINARLLIDEVLQNFPDSALSKMLLNHIASVIDIANYNIEKVAQESFLHNAKNRSSLIGKAQNFSYSICRKVPSRATTSISFDVPVGISDGDIFHLPRFSKISVNGKDLITTVPLTRNLKSTDANKTLLFDAYYVSNTQLGNLLLTADEVNSLSGQYIKNPIDLLEGELKEFKFDMLSAEARGTLKYQRYKIPDADFSDIYGSNDLYSDVTTNQVDKDRAITQVSVASSESLLFSSESLYQVNRKSFTENGGNYEKSFESLYTDGEIDKSKLPQVCVIRSDVSGGVELLFGDDTFVQTPSDTLGAIIGLRYLRTRGAKGNDYKTKGKTEKFTSESFIYAIDGTEYTPTVKANFLSHLTQGKDVETIESIKNNIPSYYSSKDRLVTRDDYINFLTAINSPFQVQTASVFGEQEYATMNKLGYKFYNPFRNVVVFSLMGELYDVDKRNHAPRQIYFNTQLSSTGVDFSSTLNRQLLDGDDYDVWSVVAYYNIISKRDLVSYRNRYELSRYTEYDISDTNFAPTEIGLENQTVSDRDYDQAHPVRKFYRLLEKKSMLNVNHVYIPPVIQTFSLNGEVFVNDFADIDETKRNINNKIYDFLSENTKFKTPIFRSQLEEIVNIDKDVDYSNVELSANSDWSLPYNGDAFSSIEEELDCRRFINSANFANLNQITPTDSCLTTTESIWFAPLFVQFQNMISNSLFTADATKGTTNTITMIIKRDANGDLGDGINETNINDIKNRLVGQLVKVSLEAGSLPYLNSSSDVDMLGAITEVQEVSFDIDTPYKITYPKNDIVTHTESTLGNLYVEGVSTYTSQSLYLVNVSFGDTEFQALDLGSRVYFDQRVSKSVNILSTTWLDTTTYGESICSYFLGFCPETYITDGIERALKSIYAELNGVIICALCGDKEPITAPIVSNQVVVCESCRCSHESALSTDTLTDTVFTPERTLDYSVAIINDAVKSKGVGTSQPLYGSRYNQEDVFKGNTYEQRNYDIAEYFNVVVPPQVLACWEGEFSLEKKIHHRIRVTERWFYETLVYRIVNELRFDAYFLSLDDANELNTFKEELLVKVASFYENYKSDIHDAQTHNPYLANNEENATLEELAVNMSNDVFGGFSNNTLNPTAYDATNNIEKFLNSNAFLNIILKLKQGFSQGIRSSMMDKYGNIVNYSLPNEIAQITSKLVFRKRI